MNLKNAVALVTGGGSGLGEATVREFAAGGAKIAILDLPSSPGAKVAESLGANALFVEADVASADQVTDAIAKTVARFASIHIAVNCAGIGRAMRTVTKDGPHSLDLFSKVMIRWNLIGTSQRHCCDWPRRRWRKISLVPTASAASLSILRRSPRSTDKSGRSLTRLRKAVWFR